MPNYGTVDAIRHVGTNQNDHGYDWVSSWPAGASLVSSNPHANNGEMTSAYKDASGNWQWFAKYNLGDFDITSDNQASWPYFNYMYSGGGPGNCDESNSDGFDIKDWEVYALVKTQIDSAQPNTCLEVYLNNPSAANGDYDFVKADGATKYSAYCDISGGGWTRLYYNSFTSNHDGVTYTIDCACGAGSGLNNGASAIDGNGWHLGVTGCHNANQLSTTVAGATVKHSFRLNFDIEDYGTASAIRHTGVNQNDHGYDWVSSWPAGGSLISSNPHANNGEMTSAYKDDSGNWQWFAKYNVGAVDVVSDKPASAPYFIYMYSGGGPGNCDESNSDGFDIKDYAVWGQFTQPKP